MPASVCYSKSKSLAADPSDISSSNAMKVYFDKTMLQQVNGYPEILNLRNGSSVVCCPACHWNPSSTLQMFKARGNYCWEHYSATVQRSAMSIRVCPLRTSCLRGLLVISESGLMGPAALQHSSQPIDHASEYALRNFEREHRHEVRWRSGSDLFPLQYLYLSTHP